jgi:NAD(P)-dependent dehydrogenase (short-subunit alcohol dehydrogenase family)
VRGTAAHPLLGTKLSPLAHLPGSHFWERNLDQQRSPYLADHRIDGVPVVPPAIVAESVLAAASHVWGGDSVRLTQVAFDRLLVLTDQGQAALQVILAASGPNTADFQLFGRTHEQAPWACLATGIAARTEPLVDEAPPSVADLAEIRERCSAAADSPGCYQGWRAAGHDIGASLRSLVQVWRGNGEALGLVEVPASAADDAIEHLHPVLLEAGLHLLHLAGEPRQTTPGSMAPGVPTSLAALQVYAPIGSRLWVHAQWHAEHADPAAGDIRFLDVTGHVLAEAHGVRMRQLDAELRWPIVMERVAHATYEPTWEPRPRAAAPASSEPGRQGTWLIFADAAGLGAELASSLAARDETPLLVHAADAYGQPTPGTYTLDPSRPDDFRRLLHDALREGSRPCRGVVYLWSTDAVSHDAQDTDGSDGSEPGGPLPWDGVLHLTQALAESNWSQPPRLWLVTRGAQPVGSDSPVTSPSQAALWGLGNVIALEHPELWGGLIDLEPHRNARESTELLSELVAPEREGRLAFRGGQRHAARLVRRQDSPHPTAPLTFRSDATYLITGGLGGLGLTVARWLADRGARHLVLLGRRAPSVAAERVLAALEQRGVRVVVTSVDVSREDDLATVLAEIAQTLPPLRGVVHAAGAAIDGLLHRESSARFATVMAGKVGGARHLDRLTRGQSLDFFVLFSSIFSLLGSPGSGSYAAANAFLDALAHQRRSQGHVATVVNWGAWAEVGMASEGDRIERFARRGLGVLTIELGLAALERVIQEDLTQVVVANVDWQRYLGQLASHRDGVYVESLAGRGQLSDTDEQPVEISDVLSRLASSSPDQRGDLLFEHVRGQVAAVMRLDATNLPAPGVGFFQSGMDSLMAVELKNRLQTSLGISLPSTVAFDYPTAPALAQYLLSRMYGTSRTDNGVRDPASAAHEDDELQDLDRGDLTALLEAELQLVAGDN